MIYLLDTNVLINANRDYYPLDMVPEFWDWLIHMGNEGKVKIPIEIYEEIVEGKDDLTKWMKSEEVRTALLLDEQSDPSMVSIVINEGYAPDLTESEVEMLGFDPFLIAYGYIDKDNRCIVTMEISKPKQQRAKRHVPDVCQVMGVQTCTTFTFTKILGFNTRWNSIKERSALYNLPSPN